MSLKGILFSSCLLLTTHCLIQNCIQANPSEDGNKKSVKIGLLISDSRSIEAHNAVHLAIMEANEKGGYNQIPFELVVRSMEGAWGTGSKQAVDLIFAEEVVAMIGSHDGRNAHLVEQVATKAQIVFISAWAGDPTLAQAFVPWFFNSAPNDIQQADFLVNTIFEKNKNSKIALVGDGSYDSESAIRNFLKINKQKGKTDPAIIRFINNGKELASYFDNLSKAGVNTIVMTGESATASLFLKELRKRKMTQPVYSYLSVLGEKGTGNQNPAYIDRVFSMTSGTWYKSTGSRFSHNYRVKFGTTPGAVAAYAYDAANLIIESIKATGTAREGIQKWLLEVQYLGVTGTIKFDDKGNRIGEVRLVDIKNGYPVDN